MKSSGTPAPSTWHLAPSTLYNVGVTSKIANLATRSVRYLEAGSGASMVLIHAFPLHADQWIPQLAKARPGWRIVAPDLRGFRGSLAELPGPADPASIDTHAMDVLELMNHLKIDRAVIGGLSMGGYVALALYARAPHRFAGLVLADTRSTADGPDARRGRDRMLDLLAREGPSSIAEEMVVKLLGETTRREQPDLTDALKRMMEWNTAEGLNAAIRALRDRPDRTELLPTIACPTVVICGAEDTLTPPSESEAMHAVIPAAKLVIVPRAGHLSNVEQPAAFDAAIWESGVFPARS